ncbi:hypothetical protein HK405_012689 [Cladochytrium tenue]|nr:hypothetical protein HK405_012689 [Cladochytrium tenue]
MATTAPAGVFGSHPPPPLTVATLTLPAPHVLLVTITRERNMNSIPLRGHTEGAALWDWFDEHPDLRVAVLTGQGKRSFSAGADLIEQGQLAVKRAAAAAAAAERSAEGAPPPLLPAQGPLLLQCRAASLVSAVGAARSPSSPLSTGTPSAAASRSDLVVASPTATFGLPEAKRGLFAAAGGLSRAVRTLGMQMASEIALAGRVLSAADLHRLGFLRLAASQDSLLDEAVELAKQIADMSPDAVIVTRAGLRDAWEFASIERAAQITEETWGKKLMQGENLRIGLEAFATKQKPNWIPSKL